MNWVFTREDQTERVARQEGTKDKEPAEKTE